MPTWAQDFGGPMEGYQIDQVTAYIMNWAEDPALCGEEFVAPTIEWPESWEELPEGDVVAGEAAYQANACFACHGQPDGSVPAAVGPELSDIAIVRKLEEVEISISRRTVTKYREAEGIPSSRERREY